MIETRRLKNVAIFFRAIISLVLPRKIINIYNNLAQKQGNVKKNKLKLGIDFLNNYKQLGVYPKFLIFKLPVVSNKDASSIRKRLLRSATSNRKKELQHVLKELSLSKNVISKQLSTTDFNILKKFITSHNKKSLQKSLYN